MNLSTFSKEFSNKWVAIGGNRWINSKISNKISQVTKKLIDSKCKIVTGGADGTDHAAMVTCLKYKIPKNSFKVFLPFNIQKQYQYERKLGGRKKAEILAQTLYKIKKFYPNSIIENKRIFQNYRKAADFRNTLIVKLAKGAIIFSPSRSKGILDALKKIGEKGIPYIIFQ
ncbi:hypothetical protein CMO83_02370 [Candidatus Woesearchaeota archaeon]|jgi:hypothetical protein|nr:hypothetical protein [Candidatus Woesearchaeota archaeon]MDP6648296.1 hypothetical protein [Candidatus Woesearchaeota archaeon]|tara:strand:- start:48980 stop:49492 length:513 start_codon:yes stop_codon:yes gene_type:complete